jgi:hypothetical protein
MICLILLDRIYESEKISRCRSFYDIYSICNLFGTWDDGNKVELSEKVT